MSLLRRLMDTVRSERLNRDLDEEMRHHLDSRAEGYEREGVPPGEARARALRRFGSPLAVRERVRDVRLLGWLDSVVQDVMLALRLLRKSPALTVAAVLSLGLAVGATTGVFAVGDSLLLRPLPVEQPSELLIPQWHSTEWPQIGIWGSNDADNNSWSFSYPMYEDFSAIPGVDLAGFQNLNNAVIRIDGEPGTADGVLVTGTLFRVLGVQPAAGRLLTESDDRPGATPVVVISHRLWERVYGGNRRALGSLIVVNGLSFTVVGVTPRSFFGMQPGRWTDLYLSATRIADVKGAGPESESMLASERFWWLQLVARPRTGTNIPALNAALSAVFARHVKPFITDRKQHAIFGFRPGGRGFAFENDTARTAMGILGALVLLVLSIACANVANLLFSRAAARRREAAMRMALGARPMRLARQHLTESLVLASLSGAGGLLFARWFASVILALAPDREPVVVNLGFGWRVPAFCLVVSLAAGLAVGLLPALTLARSSVASALRAGTTVRAGWGRRIGLARPLVGIQIALSLLLLVVAGLFVRSLANLHAVPLGFKPEGLVLFTLDPTAAGYTPDDKAAATERLARRLRQMPGVSAVAWSSFPLVDNFSWNTRVVPEGGTGKQLPPCNLAWVGPGFHELLGIPLLAGRLLDERDGRGAPKVAVVNRTFVRRYFHDRSPLGRMVSLELDRKPQPVEIVGVVGDTKYARVRRGEEPIAYLSEAQHVLPVGPTFVLRFAGERGALAGEITRTVNELEPRLPVTRIRSYTEQIAEQVTLERSLSLMASAFGVVALLLAAIGLYGVVAYAVLQRTAEMGVRLALGASRNAVLRLVLADSARVILPGALVGTAAALALTRLVASVLYGLTPTDPATIGLAVLLLLGVAGVAAYLPARRAAGINPVDALRCE